MGHLLMDTADGVYRMSDDAQHWTNVVLIPLAAVLLFLGWLGRKD